MRGEPVDVVIRPEDIMIVGEDVGMLKGVVESVIFKGVHYEMMIVSGEFKWKVQSTTMQPAGTRVGMTIVPYNIHIMHHTDMANVPFNIYVPDGASREEA